MAFAATVQAQRDDRGRLAIWFPAIGDLSAWAVTPEHLRAGLEVYAGNGYSNGYQNRLVGSVGSVYKWALATGRAPAGFVSPSRSVRRLPETAREFIATPEALAKLRAIAITDRDPRFAVWVCTLLDTGARRSEIEQRTWAEIDLKAGTIELRASATKTRKARVLHMGPDTVALWEQTWPAAIRHPDAMPFASRLGEGCVDFKKRWARLIEQAGLPGMHVHDLRKAAAVRLLRSGVGIGRAAAVLGNSSRTLEKHYAQFDRGDLVDIAAVLHQRSERWAA
jgi:integrase